MYYKIITASDYVQLEAQVNCNLEAGFKPVGGIAVVKTPLSSCLDYHQAMFYESSDKEHDDG